MMKTIQSSMSKYILIGSGGHFNAISDILGTEMKYVDFVCSKSSLHDKLNYFHDRVLQIGDDDLLKKSPDDYMIVMGLGHSFRNRTRSELYKKLKNLKFQFRSIVASTSTVSKKAKIGINHQIMNRVHVGPNCVVGDDVILNTASIIEHDCVIGNSVHVAPGAVICGGAVVGDDVFVGAGSIICEGISIPNNSFVPAGSIVNRRFFDHGN